MITSPAFSGRSYLVYGLARSGLATVAALLASGARVTAWDERAEAREAAALLGKGVMLADPLEGDSSQGGLAGIEAVIVSPGVPINRHALAARARQAGVPLIGDIELFAQARANMVPHKVVGVTGTNGKSTTTALIDHLCRTAGIPSLAGGNIGAPVLGREALPAGGVYVLELSSYQIDLTFSLACEVAILLNVTPDHLDRYDGFSEYAAAKARLFAMQSGDGVAILTGEDEPSRALVAQQGPGAAALMAAATRIVTSARRGAPLSGPHNRQNAIAAVAAALALGLDEGAIRSGLETYPGLPHRMEPVRIVNGVAYVNDSKATNPESAAPALAAFEGLHWIVGGRAKTADLGPCASHLAHVRCAYVIGEAADQFAHLLDGKVPVVVAQTLDAAVKAAAAAALPGETVLLSPACASFDQFSDYEARGQAFRTAVGAL